MKTRLLSFIDDNSPEDCAELAADGLTCKYVVIRQVDQLSLIVGPYSRFTYHANLVQRFCDLEEIASAWIQKPDQVDILEPDVRIIGGGWLELKGQSKVARFYGASKAYGPVEEDLLGTFSPFRMLETDYSIMISD